MAVLLIVKRFCRGNHKAQSELIVILSWIPRLVLQVESIFCLSAIFIQVFSFASIATRQLGRIAEFVRRFFPSQTCDNVLRGLKREKMLIIYIGKEKNT